jgi:hypothetical protein
MALDVIDRKKNFNYQIRGEDSGRRTLFDYFSIDKRERQLIDTSANNLSNYQSTTHIQNYSDLINKWANEFRIIKYSLTQEEKRAIESDILEDFLENKQSFS